MTRHEAETTVRTATTTLLALEHRDSSIHHGIHGATLVLAQAVATSVRMSNDEAIAALTCAAELAAEVLLLGAAPRMSAERAQIIEQTGSELLALSHRNALERAVAGAAAADPGDSNRRQSRG